MSACWLPGNGLLAAWRAAGNALQGGARRLTRRARAQDGASLPSRGKSVTEPGALAALAAAAAAQGLPAPGTGGPASWADNELYAPRSSTEQ